jgi:lipopolysaccharide/colanic/teichoic acid biosynthesis glycosyltransferase
MIKRLFDIIFSLIGLVIFFPLMLLIACLIKVTSLGSIFFIQERVGQYSKPFNMIKYRSMSIDSDKMNAISVKGDERITRIGVFLRKYKLDELPELWNVLVGDMSFVGPRPDVSGYADKLEGEDMLILELRPGITSKASLKYANEEGILALQADPVKYNDDVIYPDKVKLNLDYFHNNSLLGDIKIIFATIFRTSY